MFLEWWESTSYFIKGLFHSIKVLNDYGLPLPFTIIGILFYAWHYQRLSLWKERVPHYEALLETLSLCKNSASVLTDYYQEPGSEYRPDPENEHFQTNYAAALTAVTTLSQQADRAALYLEKETINALHVFLSDWWSLKEHGGGPTAELVEGLHEYATTCYTAVLEDAQRDLKRKSRWVTPISLV